MLRADGRLGQVVRGTSTRALNWKEACTPFTPPSLRQWWASLDAAMMTKVAQSNVEPVVEPIDWDEWEDKIANKTLLGQLKTEYEGAAFPPPPGADPVQLQAENDRLMRVADVLRKYEELGKAEVTILEQKVRFLSSSGRAAPLWGHQLHFLLPGLVEEYRQKHLDGHSVVATAFEKKLPTADWAAVAQGTREGVDFEVNVDLISEKIGHTNVKETLEAAKGQASKFREEWIAANGPAFKDQAVAAATKYDKEWASRVQPFPL